jgi:hypothetical protein
MDTSQRRVPTPTRHGRPIPGQQDHAERSPENQQQRQSSMKRTRRLASDVLLGAKRIAEHLAAILGVPIDENDIYYAHRMEVPIGKYGAQLIGSSTGSTAMLNKSRAVVLPPDRQRRAGLRPASRSRAPAPSPVKGAPGSGRRLLWWNALYIGHPSPVVNGTLAPPDWLARHEVLPPLYATRLAKLIHLLASDVDGGVLAAVRALGRTLKAGGCGIHDLAGLVRRLRLRPAPTQRPASTTSSTTTMTRLSGDSCSIPAPLMSSVSRRKSSNFSRHSSTGAVPRQNGN